MTLLIVVLYTESVTSCNTGTLILTNEQNKFAPFNVHFFPKGKMCHNGYLTGCACPIAYDFMANGEKAVLCRCRHGI